MSHCHDSWLRPSDYSLWLMRIRVRIIISLNGRACVFKLPGANTQANLWFYANAWMPERPTQSARFGANIVVVFHSLFYPFHVHAFMINESRESASAQQKVNVQPERMRDEGWENATEYQKYMIYMFIDEYSSINFGVWCVHLGLGHSEKGKSRQTFRNWCSQHTQHLTNGEPLILFEEQIGKWWVESTVVVSDASIYIFVCLLFLLYDLQFAYASPSWGRTTLIRTLCVIKNKITILPKGIIVFSYCLLSIGAIVSSAWWWPAALRLWTHALNLPFSSRAFDELFASPIFFYSSVRLSIKFWIRLQIMQIIVSCRLQKCFQPPMNGSPEYMM